MNNRQVAVLAASMRTGGRNMNSVADMLEDSRAIEQDLNERDRIAQSEERAAEMNTVGARMMFGQHEEQRFVEAARNAPDEWVRRTNLTDED